METLVHGNNQTFAEKKNPKEEASSSPPPPSSTSSPSHEFSFTISLQSISSSSSSSSKPNPNVRNSNGMTSSHQPPFAIDLSPADEIFFHGHLLPLHLLSHLPVSPRTSTNSLDGFTLPVKDLLKDQSSSTTLHTSNKSGMSINSHSSNSSRINSKNKAGVNIENQAKAKPNKSFSLFGLSKWRKGLQQKERREEEEEEEEEEKEKQKKKLMGLDLSHAFKKYVRMLFQRRGNGTQLKKTQAYSFSSASVIGSRKNKANNNGYNRELRGSRRESSAPASMRTSPTNSGHLLVSTGLSSASSCSASDSTMEELQEAIQAAIAHCKNSFAVDQDKVKNS